MVSITQHQLKKPVLTTEFQKETRSNGRNNQSSPAPKRRWRKFDCRGAKIRVTRPNVAGSSLVVRADALFELAADQRAEASRICADVRAVLTALGVEPIGSETAVEPAIPRTGTD